MKKPNIMLPKIVLISILGLLFSCDFASQLNKDILEIQENLKDQKFGIAITQYEQILERNPPIEIKLKVYFHLGELNLLHMAKPKRSVYYFNKIIESTSDPKWLIQANEKIGDIAFTFLRNYAKSQEIYRKLSNIRPVLEKHDFYEFRYAESLFKNNNFLKSRKILEKISKNESHDFNVRSYFSLGTLYFHSKNWQKAIEQWKEYIKREKRQSYIVETKFLIANAYETDEKLKEAYDIYYSILGEYPNVEVIKNRLEAIYARRVARKR